MKLLLILMTLFSNNALASAKTFANQSIQLPELLKGFPALAHHLEQQSTKKSFLAHTLRGFFQEKALDGLFFVEEDEDDHVLEFEITHYGNWQSFLRYRKSTQKITLVLSRTNGKFDLKSLFTYYPSLYEKVTRGNQMLDYIGISEGVISGKQIEFELNEPQFHHMFNYLYGSGGGLYLYRNPR